MLTVKFKVLIQYFIRICIWRPGVLYTTLGLGNTQKMQLILVLFLSVDHISPYRSVTTGQKETGWYYFPHTLTETHQYPPLSPADSLPVKYSMSSVSTVVYQHKCWIYSKSIIWYWFHNRHTLYSFSSPIIEPRLTGSQCRVTCVLSMSDTLRFRGAVTGPEEHRDDFVFAHQRTQREVRRRSTWPQRCENK